MTMVGGIVCGAIWRSSETAAEQSDEDLHPGSGDILNQPQRRQVTKVYTPAVATF